jgi:glycosyltransferase involved in cell wall biosynthesis
VVPLAIPASTDAPEPDDDDPPWVVSLGVVSTVKRVDDVIRAFALVRSRVAARLAVVGNVDLPYANELLALARELGVGADVTITGLVDAKQYAAWVHRSTTVVQLRTRSVGEGSATVTDAIAAKRAVITNVGAATELPEHVVDRLDVDVSVDELASHIERVLRDDAYRASLEDAAARYATTHTFDDVARRVVEIIESTTEPAYPTPLMETTGVA